MIEKNVDLRAKSSFQVGGKAQYFAVVKNVSELKEVWDFFQKKGWQPLIAGDLTNVLLPDSDLLAVLQIGFNNIIEVGMKNIEKVEEQETLWVWAGEKVARTAWELLRQGYQGLEDFASLPGSLGGAVWNNAHYGENFLASRVSAVEFFTWETGQIQILGGQELNFAYDQSFFQGKNLVITRVQLLIDKIEIEAVTGVKEKIVAANLQRQKSQPVDLPSAGCFWKNPVNGEKLSELFPVWVNQERISAGFLIERAGLKGWEIGGARVSDKHAAFIVNTGSARAQEIIDLAFLVQKTVEEKFGVRLEPEVVIWDREGRVKLGVN